MAVIPYDINTRSIWVASGISACCFILGLVLYRLFAHPLARFPGPKLAAATQLYEAFFDLLLYGGGQYTRKIRDLHAKYGPIVRVGPNELSVDDAEFHDRLYASQPTVRNKYPPISSVMGTSNGTFSTVDHFLHRRRRMANSPFFATTNIIAAEEAIKSRVDHLCELFKEKTGSTVEVRVYMAALSFDAFYQWAFGKSLNLLNDLKAADHWDRTVETISICAPLVKIFPLIMHCARKVPQAVLQRFSRKIGRIFDLHQQILAEAKRFAMENPSLIDHSYKPSIGNPDGRSKTLFEVLLRSKLPPREKTEWRIAQEGTEMFAAAFTPSRALCSAMYHVNAHPHVLKEMQSEVDRLNPDPTKIPSFATLDQSPFIRAVIKELLRISFPVGSRLPMLSPEPIEFQEWTIPGQTPVSVNTRNLLNDPEIYPEPRKFLPERWLGDVSFDEKRYFCPFGKGSRMCPGREFAVREMQIALCVLVQRFDFELDDVDWERDVAITREPFLTATSFGSRGIRLKIIGQRQC